MRKFLKSQFLVLQVKKLNKELSKNRAFLEVECYGSTVKIVRFF